MLDEDVREVVRAELQSGRVKECSDPGRQFAQLEEHFPAGINRIAWWEISEKQEAEMFTPGAASDSSEVEASLSEHRDEIGRWFRDERIPADVEVNWVGDDTDIGLKMRLATLLEIFPRLFSLPQHSYVLPSDGLWCLNFVMEGRLYFGRSPRKVAPNPGGATG